MFTVTLSILIPGIPHMRREDGAIVRGPRERKFYTNKRADKPRATNGLYATYGTAVIRLSKKHYLVWYHQ